MRKMVLNLVLPCLLLCLSPIVCGAQKKSLQFVYIAKDNTTSVNDLMTEVKGIYEKATKDTDRAVVFYMSYFESQIIVKVNLPQSNPEDISQVYAMLSKPGETMVDLSSDMGKILALFEEIPLTSPDGTFTYPENELRFYVTPSFWKLKYNEEFIAPLYFALGMDEKDKEGKIKMNIYHHRKDKLEYDKQYPFGAMNLCANYDFRLRTY